MTYKVSHIYLITNTYYISSNRDQLFQERLQSKDCYYCEVPGMCWGAGSFFADLSQPAVLKCLPNETLWLAKAVWTT